MLLYQSVRLCRLDYPFNFPDYVGIMFSAMTDFLLSLLRDGSLTLYLLTKSLGTKQTLPSSSSEEYLLQPTTSATSSLPSLEQYQAHFHDAHVTLLYSFHEHWLHLRSSPLPSDRPTVMQFERVFAVWRTELTRWVKRGQLMGWFDSRGLIRLERGRTDQGIDSRKER